MGAALGAGASYTTSSWRTKVEVKPDRTLTLTETIGVHFTSAQHGIFRTIPRRMIAPSGSSRDLIYRLQSAQIDTGHGFSRVGSKVTEDGSNWKIRLGDADREISGDATYRIKYVVYRAINEFDSSSPMGAGSELYWNVVPTGWETSIEHASFEILTPDPSPGTYSARILAGPSGSRWGVQLQVGKTPIGDSRLFDAKLSAGHLTAALTRALPLHYGITVVLHLPKGTLEKLEAVPTDSTPDYGASPADETPGPDLAALGIFVKPTPLEWAAGILIPFVPLLILLFLCFGTKPRLGPVVVQFEPPEGISAPASGVVIDGTVNPRDIIAGILEIARKGGFRLERTGKEVSLRVLPQPKGLTPFEDQLFHDIKRVGEVVTTTDLRGSFGNTYRALTFTLQQDAKAAGWLRPSWASTVGCLHVLAAVVLAIAACFILPCVPFLSAFIAVPIGFIVSRKALTWTAEGARMRHRLLGLREFILRAREAELDYMSRVDPTQALFEELLPYAVAFGAVRQWADAFKGIQLMPPDWYSGYDPNDVLWTAVLVNDLTTMNHSWGSAMSYVPPPVSSGSDSGFGGGWGGGGGWDSGGGFGGGGSVGGGGGGGGGGSW